MSLPDDARMISIVTMGDLAEALAEIDGLPMKIRCSGGQWTATIEWAYPDYSTSSSVGHGRSMVAAVSACLAGYHEKNGG
jgi:hypothetical protein